MFSNCYNLYDFKALNNNVLLVMYVTLILNLENTSDFTIKFNKIRPSVTSHSPGSKHSENITDIRSPLGKFRMLQRV
jgi:hypothetical protein